MIRFNHPATKVPETRAGERQCVGSNGHPGREKFAKVRAPLRAAAMSDQDDSNNNPDEAGNVDTQTFKRLERLRELRIEHRDLDDVINRLHMDLYVNEVQLRRLKKRKLMVKDQIARLESGLIPDLNA